MIFCGLIVANEYYVLGRRDCLQPTEVEYMRKKIKKIMTIKAEGIGMIEIILILVVLISLVLIFKNQITAIIDEAFSVITDNSSSIMN